MRLPPPRALLVVTSALVIGCSPLNPIADGEQIPNTEIASCGDELHGDFAPPTATLRGLKIIATPNQTKLDGEVLWAFACPAQKSSAATYFDLSQLVFSEDEAGYPGAELARSDVHLRRAATCADRVDPQARGGTKVDTLPTTFIVSLAETCANRKKHPTGSPFYIQVSAVGKATTCSADATDLAPRSQVGVECSGF